MRALTPLLVLALLTAACGGSDARESTAQARASASASEQAQPDDGAFVPEALRAFRCEAGEDEQWYAVGTVKNATKAPVAFRVTVQVGEGGEEVAASAVDLPAVEAEETAEFTIDELPAAGSDGPCRVQVLAVPPNG